MIRGEGYVCPHISMRAVYIMRLPQCHSLIDWVNAGVVCGHRGCGVGKQSMGSQKDSDGMGFPDPGMPAREVFHHHAKESITLG